MFGFSFSELVVVVIVALIVMGPKDLPKMLRRLGQWAGKIRRAAADLRAASGIDDALRTEGLADDIAEIRKLARGELDAVQKAARIEADEPKKPLPQEPFTHGMEFNVLRDREYPRDGADAYGALPDNAIVYAEGLPKSPLWKDALYRMGDPNAEIPPDPEPEKELDDEPLDDGSEPLHDGPNPLHDGPSSLHDGPSSLHDGPEPLHDGPNPHDARVDPLHAGAEPPPADPAPEGTVAAELPE